MSQNTATEIISGTSVLKGAPPVVAGTLILFGIPLSQWALIFTIIYTSLLIGGFIYDRFIKKKECAVCGHIHTKEK